VPPELAQAAPSALDQLDSRWERLSERFDAVLVKDVRQALRSRFFRVIFGIALVLTTAGGLVTLVVHAFNENVRTAGGMPLFIVVAACASVGAIGLVPFAAFASQSPNVPLHAVTAQRPAAQVVCALASAQVIPHAPQFIGSAPVAVSHPSSRLALQLAKPVSHAPRLHAPPAHAAPAWAKLHDCPHPPQWASDVAVSTSQPLPALMSQSSRPTLHMLMPHMPARHTGVPPGAMQTVAHEPQWVSSTWVFTSQPSAAIMLQSAKPALHMPTAQRPIAHAAVALATRHAKLHPPQLFASVRMSTSQPLAALPSHS
jgi:hypothetical protein